MFVHAVHTILSFARVAVSTLRLPMACVLQLMAVALLHLLAKRIASQVAEQLCNPAEMVRSS